MAVYQKMSKRFACFARFLARREEFEGYGR